MPRKQGNIGSLLQGVSQQNFKTRLQGMHEVVDNFIPDINKGIIKRPPIELISELTSARDVSAKMHYVKKDDNTEYIIVITDGNIKVFDLDGVEQTYTGVNNLSYLDTGQAIRDISLVTVGDYTIINNKEVTPEMEAVGVCTTEQDGSHIIIQQGEFNTTYAVLFTFTTLEVAVISSAGFAINTTITGGTSGATGKIWQINGNTLVLFNFGNNPVVGTFLIGETVTAGGSSTVNTLTDSTSEVTFSVTTPDGATASDGADIKVDKIAEDLAADIVAGTAGLQAESKGNTIFMSVSTPIDSIGMKIEVSDDSSERLMDVVSSSEYELDSLDKLPRNYTHDRLVKISSNSKINEDDFFMKFVGEDPLVTDLQRGEWEETVQACITTVIDPLLAPQALVRLSDGTFYFGVLDGSIHGGTTLESWSDRQVGSDDTNPLPAWIGRPIENLNIFQQRLVILVDEFISISKTSEYFNFFRTTATEVIDSDAIEVSPVSGQINLLKSSIQQDQDLVIFSDNTQYVIRGNVALTPSSITVSVITNYTNNTFSGLLSTGDSILFPINSEANLSEIQELYIRDNNRSRSSNNLSTITPEFISGSVGRSAIDTNLGLAIYQADSSNILYCYKYINNNKERLQSAWFSITSTIPVVDYVFYEDGLLLITRDSSNMYLSKLDFSDVDTQGLNYNIYLDNKEEFNSVTTSVTTSYEVGSNTIVVQGEDCPNAGYTVDYTAVGNALTLEEDMQGGTIYVGKKYDSTFKITAPRVFTQDGRPTSRGRLVVNQMIIDFEDTVRFNTTNVSKGTTYNKEYEGVIAGESLIGNPDISSGTFKVAIKEKNSDMDFSITSDTHFPVRITNIDYEGQYSPNARR